MTTPRPMSVFDDVGEDGILNTLGTTFKFKRLKEHKPGASWILMVYGPSKAGKTYFAGTTGPRTLFINIGDGLETLLSPAFTKRYDSKEMIIVDIRETNSKDSAEAFDAVCNAIDYALKHFPDRFDTIVLDEATAFRRYALNRAMELNTESRKGPRGNRISDFVKPEIGDYGIEMQMIEWFLSTYTPIFKEVNKNFLMLAHERQVYGKPAKIGDEAPLKKIMPGFTGKTFPDVVPAYFDDVWRIEAVGGGTNMVYRLRTAGDENKTGGSRHGGIFQTVEADPNYLKLLARIKNVSSI